MAKKPTTRKSKTAKPKAAKKAKVAKPKTARAKAAKPKARKAAAKAPARRAKAPAKRAKAPARRAKAPAKKAVAERAAPKATAPIKATPSGSSDKDHLISVIQSGTGSSKKAATDTLATILSTISASLKKNQKVQLVGFGSFEVVKRRARKGRNPATGASIRIKASKGVRFKAGSKLKGGI
jgi:DNA-binding protein HU-beta